jgi:hypothetical protein
MSLAAQKNSSRSLQTVALCKPSQIADSRYLPYTVILLGGRMLLFLGWLFVILSFVVPILQIFELVYMNVSPLFPALPLFVSGVVFISLHKILVSIQAMTKKPNSSALPPKTNSTASVSTDFEGIPRKQGESNKEYWKRVSTETDLEL